VDKSKVIAAVKEIDLYRAKYRHNDLTPYAWCFHGDKAQGWTGQAINHRLMVQDSTKKIENINADLYKYISFNIEIPLFWVAERKVPVLRPCRDFYEPIYYVKPVPCSDKIGSIVRTVSSTGTYQTYTDLTSTRSIDTSQLDALRTGGVVRGQPVICGTDIVRRCAACNIGEYNRFDDDIIIPNPIPEPTPITRYEPPEQPIGYRTELYEEAIPDGYSYELRVVYYKTAVQTTTTAEGGTVNKPLISSYTKSFNLHSNSNFKVLDMSSEANWSGTISKVEFILLPRYNSATIENCMIGTKRVHPVAFLEYFKIDKINLAQEVDSNYSVTSIDINTLRAAIDTINKTPEDWSNKGTADDRVKNFLSVIKRKDFNDLVSVTRSVAPYNGCATCDAFTCECYALADGYVPCAVCNTCNSYQGCSSCNMTCYTEARTACTCNSQCYTEARACGCYATCYGYRTTCTCNGGHY
jgi:hypothetical protein